MNSPQQRRVVISGMGVVCPLGLTLDDLWQALCEGKSGVGPIPESICGPLPVQFGAAAREFTGKIEDFGPLDKTTAKAIRKGLKVMCRESQMAVAAGQRALADAGIGPGSFDPERIGVNFGSDYMLTLPDEFTEGIRSCLDGQGRFDFSRWPVDGMTKMSPLWLLKYLPNMPASHIAIYNDFRGPSNSVTLREASINWTIREALEIIRTGRADAILVGATGTRLHPMKTVHAIQQEEVVLEADDPAGASRPFDKNRRGMVLGEGAAALLLETVESAQARGAKIYAEVVGGAGAAAIGKAMVADRRLAIENALRSALRSADMSPNDISFVNAHGLSTRAMDRDEAQAVHNVFSSRSNPVPVVAAKGHFGNLGAGAGAVELIAGVLCLINQQLFPVLNYSDPDPECPVEPVRELTDAKVDSFVNINVTPQGQATAAVIKRWQP